MPAVNVMGFTIALKVYRLVLYTKVFAGALQRKHYSTAFLRCLPEKDN
jgi:hypothetical protein